VEAGEKLAIPLENLLTPEYLRRLSWTPPEPAHVESVAAALAEMGARPWQIDATAQLIAEAFVEAHQMPDASPEADS
jgi:ribonuclease D